MLTLSALTTLVYGKMGVPSDSTTFDSATVVKPRISSVYQNVCGGQIADMFKDGKVYMAPLLRVLAKQLFPNVPQPTKAASTTAAGTTSFPVASSASYPSTGAVFCEGEVLTYSANVANTLTLTAPTAVQHVSGAEVDFVQAVPSDWGKPVDAMDVSGQNYYDFVDDRGVPSTPDYFTVKPGPGTSGDFLWFSDSGRFRVTYVLFPSALANDTDASVLPDKIDQDVIAPLVAGSLLWENFSDDPLGVRGKGLLLAAYAALVTFYSQNAFKDKKFRRKVQRPAWQPIPSTR